QSRISPGEAGTDQSVPCEFRSAGRRGSTRETESAESNKEAVGRQTEAARGGEQVNNRIRNSASSLAAASLALLMFVGFGVFHAVGQTKSGAQTAIPKRPEELKYQTLTYVPPKREKYRHVLSNGVVAYLVEDHDLPLINVSLIVRTGGYLEPKGKEGLASLAGSEMRGRGNTFEKEEEYDEAVEFCRAHTGRLCRGSRGGRHLY